MRLQSVLFGTSHGGRADASLACATDPSIGTREPRQKPTTTLTPLLGPEQDKGGHYETEKNASNRSPDGIHNEAADPQRKEQSALLPIRRGKQCDEAGDHADEGDECVGVDHDQHRLVRPAVAGSCDGWRPLSIL